MKYLLGRVKKEGQALCRWVGCTLLVLSMLTIFTVVDGMFKEGFTPHIAVVLLLSLVGLLGGNLLWMLAGEVSVFEENS